MTLTVPLMRVYIVQYAGYSARAVAWQFGGRHTCMIENTGTGERPDETIDDSIACGNQRNNARICRRPAPKTVFIGSSTKASLLPSAKEGRYSNRASLVSDPYAKLNPTLMIS